MQLASKMRFVSAQFEALLGTDLWLTSATHANAMARRLDAAVRDIDGVQVQRPVQANAVFAVLPKAVTARLQKRFKFYTWDEATGEVRWMTRLRHHRRGRRRVRRGHPRGDGGRLTARARAAGEATDSRDSNAAEAVESAPCLSRCCLRARGSSSSGVG